MKRLALAGVLLVLLGGAAADPAEQLSDPLREAAARKIFREVRCVVCQNESIDDSPAELASDLRMLIREQVQAGKSPDQIKTFLVERYGEVILLRPSLSMANLLLWLVPGGVLLAGLGLLRQRVAAASGPDGVPLSEAEQGEIERLLAGGPARDRADD